MKKILVIFGLVASIIMLSGCLDSFPLSDKDSALVGTWESGVINSYYIHQMIFDADGSYVGRWLYATGGAVYSEVSGTWTADGTILTTVTDHTDMYSYVFSGSDSYTLQIDGESRVYTKS